MTTTTTTATGELEFSLDKEWAKFAEENPWACFIPEFAKDASGQEFMRRQGSSVVYKVVKEDDEGQQKYKCAQCGSEILGAKIAHPIWDGPFPCSGSGRCHYETVPYCPKCEEEPSFHGNPISVGPKVR